MPLFPIHRAIGGRIDPLYRKPPMTDVHPPAVCDPDDPTAQALIARLGQALVPVRRLRAPIWRTAGWLLVVGAIGLGLLWHDGLNDMVVRLTGTPDLAWAAAGAALTALGAGWAAFALSVPGRPVRWAWLPLPGLALWVGASVMGCDRTGLAPGTVVAPGHPTMDCLGFILMVSVPLSVVMGALVRRACPLHPLITATLVGLASAAGAACLLTIGHPYDAGASDLLTHAVAIGLVVAAAAGLGGRLFRHG
jgi:hypothetical protein